MNKCKPLLGGCSRCRSMLRVAVSGDDGERWDRVATVEDEVDHSLRIHYPTLTQRGQGFTLVHFSAQLERFVWDRGCAQGFCSPCQGGLRVVSWVRHGSS